MELEGTVLERVRADETLSRWEKSELGRDLRRLGLSYGEIRDLIPVKKSTLATWCRDVELTPDQIQGIATRCTPVPGKDLAGFRYTTQVPRRLEIELIRSQAKLEAHHLADGPFWTAGLTLYWARAARRRSGFRWRTPIRRRSGSSRDGQRPTYHRTGVGGHGSISTLTTTKLRHGGGGPHNSISRYTTSPRRSSTRRNGPPKEPPQIRSLHPVQEKEHRRLLHHDGLDRVHARTIRQVGFFLGR